MALCRILPVVGVLRAGLMNLNYDEDMLEMGADGLWSEGQSTWLLENDRHNVVSDVSLPQQLMRQNQDTGFTKQKGQGHS